MSHSASNKALDDLEKVLEALKEEIASWRTRALKAESDSAKSAGIEAPEDLVKRLADLETENEELKQRLDEAKGRAKDLLARLAFLEEQTEVEAGTR